MDSYVDNHHEYCTGGFDPEDIVITGISGRFPDCDSLEELVEGLMNKTCLITHSDARFEKGACKLPFNSSGLIRNLEKFDADYFCLPYTTTHSMDPSTRKCMEVSYEALFDAGYDPTSMKGANVGVYNATTNDDAQLLTMGRMERVSAFSWLRCLNANRVSYCFDFIGPSYSVDTACSSSAVATWAAVNDIAEGRADAAIINACQVNMCPVITYAYLQNGIGSPTGVNSMPFDKNSDGINRTEAVAAVFIQKAKHARRAYAKICSLKCVTSGFVPEGISVPSMDMQIKTTKDVLEMANLTPDDIEYFEAHGTGTNVGDPIELNSIATVFCKNGRKKPLYIGSVKSNIGHTEAASGLCGIIKATIALETGKVPPNYKYSTPNPNCKELVEGKIKVLTEPLPLKSPYIPVNSFGLAGSIVQVLLKQNPNVLAKSSSKKSDVPKFILYPATTESGAQFVFDYIRDHPDLPEEFYALLHKLAFCPTLLKPFRGYALYQNHSEPVTSIKTCSADKRPVWFIYTGMGCQWCGMGLQLMQIETFARTMRKCDEVLKRFGVEIFKILDPNSDIFKDRKIMNAMLGIASIQIAFTDLLAELGIKPDGIVGHSTGEVVAAYADGCITLEETLLAAYWRGYAVEATDLPRGAMAAVGLTWEQAKKRCPENVYAACHNADDSVTISGFEKEVVEFVEVLKKENVFARVVNAYGYCFHCNVIKKAAPALEKELVKILTNPKPRTSRWISSSYAESEWNLPGAKVVGSEYFVHNLISPVLFNEALQKIPPNAITVEIAPHSLLQAILKRGIGSESVNISLMKRNDPNNIKIFFENIGKLYQEGLDPRIENLYPPVKFPVPRGTPMMSHLMKWNHSMDFEVPRWEPESGEQSLTFHLLREDSYLMDHFIDGRSLFPATGYIFIAWEMLASKLKKNFTEMPVFIENFKIHRATVITKQTDVKFNFNLLKDNGYFEISNDGALVASGQVSEWKNVTFSEDEPTYQSTDSSVPGADIYNELKMAGYQYGRGFQNILEMNVEATQGLVQWNDRWIPFLDALLLFFGIINNNGDFQLPTAALSFKIDPTILLQKVEECDESPKALPVNFNPDTEVCRSIGIEITKLMTDPAPLRIKDVQPIVEEYKYIPYICSYTPCKETELQVLRYVWACNKFFDIIGEKLKLDVKQYKFFVGNDSGIDIEEYIENLTEKHSLLKCLIDVAENANDIQNKKKELSATFHKTIGKDILNSLMITEYPLRIMLEIIVENSFRRLNVLEVSNSGFSTVLPSIAGMVKKYSSLKFKSSVLISSPEYDIDENELSELNIMKMSNESIEGFAKEKDQDLVIGSFMGGSLNELRDSVQTLASLVKPTGFILFYYKEKLSTAEQFLLNLYGEKSQVQSRTAFEKIIQDCNLLCISKVFDSFSMGAYLLRPIAISVPYKILKLKEDNQFTWLEEMKDLLADKETEILWLVSEENSISGIVGMVNCLKQEPGGEKIRCVFISLKSGENKPPPFNFDLPFYKSILSRNLVMNVWHNGSWGSFRHILLSNQKELKNVEHSYVNCKKYGDLSSFEWIESSVKYAPRTNEKLVHIYYSALNFKDVMLATGKLSLGTTRSVGVQGDDSVLGLEFSGKDESGRRVAGIIPSRGMATSTLANPSMMIDVPDKWSLEEAATVPVVYATSYYALIDRAQLKKGETILIHSGTGGIGIAAINIALSLQCEVFTTVGNEEKKKYLRKLFPQIKEENIGCSRNTLFESMVLNQTNGRGVDVVLNSLADDKFQASVRCIATHGRFIEIGKYDLALDRNLGLRPFLKNISFHGVFLDQLFEKTPRNVKTFDRVMQLVKDGIKSGVVKPLDRTVFMRDEVEKAFRYMAKGIHVGKVVLKIRDEEPDKRAIPKPLVLPAIPITYFFSNKVYIIIGGLGGFGIELTKWMLTKGAKNIILTSRYGARTPYQYLCLKRWQSSGANVQVFTLNAAKRNEAEKLLKEAQKIGTIGGIFNSAVVLKDAFIDCQTPTTYEEVCAPKAIATKHLDELSRKLCPSLDYFVCFSSISCGRGNAGQTNYGYANSVMERICEDRKNSGLHGLAIEWGIIGEVGVVHRHMGDDAMIAGVSAQSVKSCLDTLDLFCQGDYTVVSSYMTVIAAKKTQRVDLIAQLENILGMAAGGLKGSTSIKTLGDMGIDSLLAVEIQQLLESFFDTTISIQELFEMKLSDIFDMSTKASTKEVTKKAALVSTPEIKLPTFLNKELTIQLTDKVNGSPVFIVNIGDTDVARLKLLAETLDRPVYTLQWTSSITAKSMEELAAHYLQIIESKGGSCCHLIGFSLGGSLAFEIARQSEKRKLVKSVTLLDGSTNLVKNLSKEKDTRDPEVATLLGFVEQFSPENVPHLEDELVEATGTEQRMKITLNFLTAASTSSVSKSEISDAIFEFIRKTKIIQSYIPNGKLNSDLTLIEDPARILLNDVAELKGIFQQVVNGKVSIHRVLSQEDLTDKDAVNRLHAVLNEEVFSKELI